MSDRATIQLPGKPLGVRVAAAADAAAPSAQPAEAGAADAADRSEPDQQLAAERAEISQARQALENGLAKLDTLRAELIRQAEQQLVELALDIARTALMQEIQAGRYEIDPIVKAALQQVPPRQTVVAHLHPEDLARCQMAGESSEGGGTGIRFVADPSVPRAECVLATSQGSVQFSLSDNLGRIGEALSTPE
jgi:flagellar assembly protein FliH